MRIESTIQDIVQRTPTVKSFQIPRPDDFVFKAGQFMEVALKVEGKEQTKYFTISSSPAEQNYIEFTKRITDSAFSKALDQAQNGEWIRISGPMGLFRLDREEKKIAFVSGGIGITPIRSMCAFATQEHLDRDIILLYGNRSSSDIPFRDEFDQMQADNPHLRVVHTLDQQEEGWGGRVGFINKDMIMEEIPDYADRTFFVCGPPKMVEGMVGILTDELSLPDSQLVIENFSGY